MRPRRNAFSIHVPSPPQRLGILIEEFSAHMEPVSIANLVSYNRKCARCKQPMCDYEAFQSSHTCTDGNECESAYLMKACGHIAGRECLPRALEKWPECPMCRTLRDGDDVLWTYDDTREESWGISDR
jgi:hypothetical protein